MLKNPLYKFMRAGLFLLPPEIAHTLSLHALRVLAFFHKTRLTKPVTVMGLTFQNPVGLAAGLDKNAEYVDALAALGFGFIEVGTVTPKPQAGNSKPRLFRLPKYRALINRMGFNGCGIDTFVENLKKIKSDVVVGVNIGKNALTPIENALNDYLVCFARVYPYADYVTVNVSSPNTAGLRELQHGEYLQHLLRGLKHKQVALQHEYDRYVPLVVKLAPDLTDSEIAEIAPILLGNHIDGLIVGNTSLSRIGVLDDPHTQEPGGLSGAPIRELALHVQTQFYKALGDKVTIIGVGGIFSGEDAMEKFSHGARLVQLYTGFIYEGPSLITDINRQINT